MRKISLILIFSLIVSLFIPTYASENEVLFNTSFKNSDGISLSSSVGCTIGTGTNLQTKVTATAEGNAGSAIASIGNKSWYDYTLECDFDVKNSSNDDDRVVFVVNNKSSYNAYGFSFSVQNKKMYVLKDNINYSATASYTKQEHPANILTGQNKISISAKEGRLVVFLNGEQVLDFQDIAPVPYGSAALGAVTKGEDTFEVDFKSLKLTGKVRNSELKGAYTGSVVDFNENFDNGFSDWDTFGKCEINEGNATIGNGNENEKASIVSKKAEYSDIVLDWYGKVMSNDMSVYVRRGGVNLYYRFDFSKENGGTVTLTKRINNKENKLTEVSGLTENFGLDLNEFNSIRIVSMGESFGVFYGILLKPILIYTDEATGLITGSVGFESSSAVLDDILISSGGSPVEAYNYMLPEPKAKADMSDADEEDNIYKNIYVSVRGNDNGDGTESNPFKTVERAVSELKTITRNMTGNVVVNIESGTYEMDKPIVIDNDTSGKNGYYVIFKSIGGRALLSGGKKVSEPWSVYSGNIYKTHIESLYEEGFKEFYVNGERKSRAGAWEMNPEFLSWKDSNSKYISDGIYISKSILPETKHPEDLEWITNIAWRAFHLPVEAIEKSDLNDGYWKLRMQQPAFYHSYEIGPEGANTSTHRSQKTRIENALELLDEPGEWFYDKYEKTLYYYPDAYEDINSADCFIPGIDNLFEIKGESRENRAGNIVFDGIDFSHTGYEYALKYGYVTNQTPFVKDIKPEDGTLLEMDVEYAVKVQNADNLKFKNNKFSNLGSSAMHFIDAVSNVSIVGNVFDDIADSGIVLGHSTLSSMLIKWDYLTPPDNFYISNNIINDVGAEYSTGIGIATTYTTNLQILHNEISNIGLDPLSLGWGWSYPATLNLNRNCTMYNLIRDYNYKQTVHDLAAIYMLTAQMDSVISENYIVNDFGGSYGAIYYDQGASYVVTSKNVIKDVNASVFILSEERHDNFVSNNYTTDPGVTNSGTESYITDLKEVKNYNWPSEAQAVIDNAGLEEEYEYIRNFRTDKSFVLDNAFKMTAYKDGSGSVLRLGTLMKINNADKSVKAKFIDGKLYLPKEEMDIVCFTKIPSFYGACMNYIPSDEMVTIAYSTNGTDVKKLKAPVGKNEWSVDGMVYKTDFPVIIENGKPYISVEDVFNCLGIKKTVVYSGNIAAVCEKGFDFSFDGNENTASYINDRLGF